MQKTATFTKTLESKIIGSQYETAPSLQKHKVESHFDKKNFYQTLKENSEKEIMNPAEESALKAELEILQLQQRNKKTQEERLKHIKQISKEKMIIEKKAKFKEFIKQRNKKSFSKEKQDKYDEGIRKKIIEKHRSSNANININTNEFNVNLYQNGNIVLPEANKELFYNTIRVNENGDLKTNMVISEYGNYEVENEQRDFKNNFILNAQNKLYMENNNNQNIEIKYQEQNAYDFSSKGKLENEIIYYNNNNKSSNDYNCCYENFTKQSHDFTQDSNNYLIESADPNLNNLYYANNDSFNIFKENQELIKKHIQINSENIIIEENENEENFNDESNKDKIFISNIIEKSKENKSSNVFNLRDDFQLKIREKLKEKQKEFNAKNPFSVNKIELEGNANNSTTKTREFLANSRLTFGENLTQDLCNISSANNQVSSCNEINFSAVGGSYNVNGNLRNKKNYLIEKNAKNKSFDSVSMHLNIGNNNNDNYNNYNNFLNVNKESDRFIAGKKVKEIDVNKYLDRKVTKIKAFRKSGTFIEKNYNNTDANCEYLNDGSEKNSQFSYNTENYSSFADSELIEDGHRTYNFALENKKREMLKKQSIMSQTGKTSGWDNSSNMKKMIKR
jgi:hypothetical protein